MFLSIEQVNDLLKQWNNTTIKITKLEINDIDETVMHFKDVTYENESPTIDGYEPIYNMKLTGPGTIQTENNNPVPLPSSLYEIPIEDNSLYEFDGNTLIISTQRGTYKIEQLDENLSQTDNISFI